MLVCSASPPQSWSQLVPISNERVSSDGDDEEEEATGAVKIDSELVREVFSRRALGASYVAVE